MCFCRMFSFYHSPASFFYHQLCQDLGILVVGRIIAGISVGLTSTVVPIYQSEISAPSICGRLVYPTVVYYLGYHAPVLSPSAALPPSAFIYGHPCVLMFLSFQNEG